MYHLRPESAVQEDNWQATHRKSLRHDTRPSASRNRGPWESHTVYSHILYYQVMTTIMAGNETSTMTTASLNYEAGPNLVQDDVIPTRWLANMQPVRTSIRAAVSQYLNSKKSSVSQSQMVDTNPAQFLTSHRNWQRKWFLEQRFLAKNLSALRQIAEKSYQNVVTQALSSRVLKTKMP